MNADTIALLLVIATSFPATMFALIYGTTTPWWRSWIGRALFISSTGLALLVDIALAYQFFGDDYLLRDVVRVTVYALICAGAWLKFIALCTEKVHARRDVRTANQRWDAQDPTVEEPR